MMGSPVGGPRTILHYCALEVERQHACPTAVYWMVDAWDYARSYDGELTLEFIEEIGRRVEPEDNRQGFRTVPIFVGGHMGAPVGEIRERLSKIIEAYYELEGDPNELYKEFQLIHPFRDGNGRTGKILLNWMNDSMEKPIMPPNFFNCANP